VVLEWTDPPRRPEADDATQTADVFHGSAWPVLGVTSLERSLDFYCGVLGCRVAGAEAPHGSGEGRTLLTSEGRPLMLELVARPEPSAWAKDDLQCGIRHLAFKVDDVDRWAARVKDAGAPFTMEPRDATGGVRIAFFLDPDGSQLELVQGNVRYSHPWSEELIAAERATPAPPSPRLDHVALSVADLERTLAFYRRGTGAEVIGQLRIGDDPRGFLITYMRLGTGPAILEIFSFDVPMLPNPWQPHRTPAGLLRVALSAGDPAVGVRSLLAAGGSLPERGRPDGEVVLDPDGTPLEIAAGAGPERSR
jgi:catechol 2,3-dioxygenase-like lactoylglutathione lyase family enzyme